jgi:hypothetical protein
VLAAGLVVAASKQNLTPKETAAARKLYIVKCAKCHRFYEPNDYLAAEWQRWMDSMNRKSKLKPDQGELLIRYLDSYRAGELPGKPQDKPSAGAPPAH